MPARVLELSRGVLPLFVALGLLNASNYIFHVAVSRLLGPIDYGALAALLAVVMVLSVPLSVTQTVIAKRVARQRVEGREREIADLTAGATKAMVWVGVAGGALLAVASPLIAWFLHTEAAPAALLGAYWLASLALAVPLGVLQGRLRFTALGGVALLGVAVRLGVGIGLVWAGMGVLGAVLGTVLAQVVSLAVALPVVGLGRGWWRRARATTESLRGEFRIALMSLGAFWLLAEVDLMLVRRYLEPLEAGYYSSAGLVARALLFLPGAISIVALPRFAEARNGEEAHRRLRLAVGAVAGLVALAFPVLVFLRDVVVRLAFGSDFLPAASLVPVLAMAMGLLAVVNLLVFFHIAEGTRVYRVILSAAGVEAALITVFHGSAQQVGLIVLGTAVATALISYHAAVAACRWRPVGASMPSTVDLAPLNGRATVDVSVILPCHNASGGLSEVLRTLHEELEHIASWEIIVVSDGSTDETVRAAREFLSERVRVVHEPVHIGKGHALRVGLGQARGRYVAFMDADGDIDPRAIRPALSLMDLYEPDIVLGSKRHPLSQVQYPALRRAMSWTYHKVCRLLFLVNVRDTQTGFKVFRREVLTAVLPRMLEKRYAFDMEFLVVARRLGFKRVFEVPIRLDYRFDSTVNLRQVRGIVTDTLAIAYRRHVLGTYEPGVAARPRPTTSSDGRLRVLFLNWRDICNPDAGGAETFTHEVAKRWVADGHEVTLYTSRVPGAPQFEKVDGVRVRRMGRLRSGTFHLRVQWELARLRGYDLVIDEINTIPFFTPLWLRRLPMTVALIHQLAIDVWDAELPTPLAWVGRGIERRLLRLYRDVPVVTVSESTRRDLEAQGIRNVTVVPNGRDDPPELNGIKKEPVPTFLFVGRMTPNKRPDHAVAAFRLIKQRLPSARLWIIGQGPMEDRIRRALPPGVEMLGHVSRGELHRRMARAHCLLVPSVREGWGLVVVEANASGTPAVGYDVPGIRDSIRDGVTGSLATEPQPVYLANAAVSLVTDHERYEKTCEEALLWSRPFSWQRTATEFLDHVLVADSDNEQARIMSPGRDASLIGRRTRGT